MTLPTRGLFRSLYDFLENEGDRSERGVEGRRKARRRASGRRPTSALFWNAECSAQFRNKAARDVHGGTFPAKAHPTSNVEQPRKKFDHDGAEPDEPKILPEGELELRNPAPRRTLVDAKHEPAAT